MDGLCSLLVLLQADPAPAAAAASYGYGLVAVALGVLVLPFVLGTLLANALRMKDFSFRIGLVLFSIALSLSPFVLQVVNGNDWRKALRVGIDLAGGTNLLYQIDVAQAERDGKTVDSATVDKLTAAIGKRLNPSGAEEITIRRIGKDRVEVIIPGADRDVVEQKKRLIVELGTLEFAILANEKDHPAEIAKGRALSDSQDEVRSEGRLTASWRNVAPGQRVEPSDRVAMREVQRLSRAGEQVTVRQFLVKHDDPDRAVTGKHLVRANPEQDPESGQLVVSFSLNARGTQLFSALTGRYAPDATEGFSRRLSILLNGEIHSAPTIQARIPYGRVKIEGNFKKKEIDQLVAVLNAGSLELPLVQTPISEFTISPLLGVDVQQKGITAILVSAVAVFVFMVYYYRVAGLIAVLCLFLNLLIVVGSMAFIEATFTLPGLAGLVLTIGMAVDSNVLIYERIREELERGSNLRRAIKEGFDKALAAIVDSNVTTLITAVILYMIGTDQVRGFAVSLFIGLSASLFAVLYFGHMAFEIIEHQRWVKTLSMKKLFSLPHVDFLKYRWQAALVSIAVIAAGIGALAYRGKNNLDIDFTGGSMVTFEFTKSQSTPDIRSRLQNQFDTPISLEQLTLSRETGTADAGRRYRMRTMTQDTAVVRDKINAAFANSSLELVRVTMQSSELAAVSVENIGADSDRMIGGLQSKLTLSGPLASTTIVEYIADELAKIIGTDSRPKYTTPRNLLTATGQGTPTTTEGGERFAEFLLRSTPEIAGSDLQTALAAAQARLAAEPVYDEINTFDTAVAGETLRSALLAIVASLIVIIVYIWFRFERVYFGYAAVTALVHDALVVIGSIALGALISLTPIGPLLLLEDFKMNMGFVAAVLTIIGYSLNDTIVIFDRLREIKGKSPHITYDMVNMSVNQTLSRTLLTAFTTLLVVAILYIFGGEGIHCFAFSFIIGVIAGTYSTVYIANPVLLWLVQRAEKAAARPVRAA